MSVPALPGSPSCGRDEREVDAVEAFDTEPVHRRDREHRLRVDGVADPRPGVGVERRERHAAWPRPAAATAAISGVASTPTIALEQLDAVVERGRDDARPFAHEDAFVDRAPVARAAAPSAA